MKLQIRSYQTPSGYLLPSIHSAPPFFSPQPNITTQAAFTEQWTRLILSYARHRKIFFLRIDDTEETGNDWDEVLRNPRINRRILPAYLNVLLESLVLKNLASYEPVKQTRAVLLYWRLPEEWGEVLHEWAISTGQINTILTFYEISSPPVESPLSGIPAPLLRKAIVSLTRTGRAQLIAVSDGEGVRFFMGVGR